MCEVFEVYLPDEARERAWTFLSLGAMIDDRIPPAEEIEHEIEAEAWEKEALV